jgi:hypothetical protein
LGRAASFKKDAPAAYPVFPGVGKVLGAAIGQAAAAPPNSDMNSRRFIALTPNARIMASIAGSRPCIAAKTACSCPLWVDAVEKSAV